MLANPAVCGGPESNFFSCFAPALRSFHKGVNVPRHPGLANFWTLDAFREELRGLWRKTMRPIVDTAPGARILLEKTPSHALWMAEIDELLPRCRFIHLIRDSRAVVASNLAAGREWGGAWAPKATRDAAISWYRHVRAARDYGAKLDPSRYVELRYEDLHGDPAARVRAVYDFIGLPMPRADVERIVSEQAFDRQKEIGGTPFTRAGDLAATGADVDKEPAGFFRQGTCDGWKKELPLRQQIVVWHYTRKLMRECGYGWRGVCAESAPATAARLNNAAAPALQ